MDINTLTLGEVAKIEELSGQPLASLSDEAAPKGKLMTALAFVIKRRQDPKYTMIQAEGLRMADIQELLADDGDQAKN